MSRCPLLYTKLENLCHIYSFSNRENDFDAHWSEISEEIKENGTYQLTEDELTFGAKTSWRNAARCSGRSLWNSLVLRDCRYVFFKKFE